MRKIKEGMKMATVKKDEVKGEPVKAEEERVRVLIPYVEGEDPEVTVGINGTFYKIQKGRVVSVPIPVAKILENADLHTLTAKTEKSSED